MLTYAHEHSTPSFFRPVGSRPSVSFIAREGAAMPSEEALHVIVRSRAKPARPTPQLTRLCQLRSWISNGHETCVQASKLGSPRDLTWFVFFFILNPMTRLRAFRIYAARLMGSRIWGGERPSRRVMRPPRVRHARHLRGLKGIDGIIPTQFGKSTRGALLCP